MRSGTDLPIAVYPNSGETYDPVTKTWHGKEGQRPFGDCARDYFLAGASAAGGCCTTVASHILQVNAVREELLKSPVHMR